MYCGVPEEDPEKLMALVLTGGNSSNKVIDKENDESRILHTTNLCTAAKLSVFYSVKSSLAEQYKSILPVEKIILDEVNVKGALAGLLSFYLKYPNADVLLLPCDSIELTKQIIEELMATYETLSIGHDIIVYQHTDEFIDPIPGIYTAEALKKIYWLFASGELKNHSLTYCINISNTFSLPIQAGM
jgi:molybdopterin-guanine dinucleotide biosynthesis protein A